MKSTTARSGSTLEAMAKFVKGVSGNPSGQPKGVLTELREKHGDDLLKIVEVWIRLAKGEAVEGFADAKAKERLRAGELATDRLWGKPQQTIDATVRDGQLDQLVDALRMSPHERRERLAQIAAEDEAAIAAHSVAEDDAPESTNDAVGAE